MAAPASHKREQERLAALREYGILDTPRESDFDDVVKILADICDVPFSTVTLIDHDRQWHKAAFGIGDLRETPRDVSFCAHSILSEDPLVLVPDVTKDARFADNPFVTGDPRLRFYAAALLRTPDGLPLGTVCVVDFKPRVLDERQKNMLRLMAKQVMAQIALRREIAERRMAEKQQQMLIGELHHRVKNTLATVQAIIQMSLREARDLDSFRDGINERIGSLAKTHTLLSAVSWSAVPFRELLATELDPYHQIGRLTLDGADFRLDAQTAVTIGMVIHELTTNASKYGALSNEQGKLAVAWTCTPAGDENTIDLAWTESGGPVLGAPGAGGFGSALMRRIVERQLHGKLDVAFRPDGLQVRMRMTLPAVTHG